MKSGEDFRRAMRPADDSFVRVIAQALNDLRRKRRGVRTAGQAPVAFSNGKDMEKRLVHHG